MLLTLLVLCGVIWLGWQLGALVLKVLWGITTVTLGILFFPIIMVLSVIGFLIAGLAHIALPIAIVAFIVISLIKTREEA